MKNHPRRAARGLAALALVGVVAAGCSANGATDDATPPATASGSPTAEASPTGAPAGPEDQAEIIAITKTYVTGLNNGDAKMLEHAMCAATLAQFGDLSVGARPSPTPQQINGVTEIAVAGDVAFGMVEYSLVNDPAAQTAPMPLAYKNEGGWKVCTEP